MGCAGWHPLPQLNAYACPQSPNSTALMRVSYLADLSQLERSVNVDDALQMMFTS